MTMKNSVSCVVTGFFLFASPLCAQDGELRIPSPSPPGQPSPPGPLPISVEDEPSSVQEDANQRAYVTPSNYEALGPRPADYPVEALLEGQEGDVGYTLYAGADGKPEACEVVESSGFELLDEATCKLMMERGVFEPATDGSGKPVMGEFSSRYRWVIKEPEFGETMTVHVAYVVGENGVSSDCEVIEVSGMITDTMRQRIERDPCPGSNSLNAAPYRDENGIPIAKRVTVNFQVTVEDVED